jgi:hypothetical protein
MTSPNVIGTSITVFLETTTSLPGLAAGDALETIERIEY